ncbi:sugar ABC transporter substrate-binding protein [Paraglaciecola hydrolytica]|uniref:Sugar ABC transporter substrate-binding protein n=1 Tax=Paraglaciecola hydrolytica TaxID=1799789 RepID=A0A148KMX5_9ALTE|nr:sugar ABC transporter substrate-binding protein [Paraglaciecola hydrolytica]
MGSGDVVIIDVYNEKDLYVKAQVPKSGLLRIPLLGDIDVVGKTPVELSQYLEEAYLDGYLVLPSVTVLIDSFRPIYVKGAVKSAGSFKFELDLTVDQAIAIAGGLKDRASNSNWYVIRGKDKERIKVTKESRIFPGDILDIEESLF